MRERLQDLLVCPACGSALEQHVIAHGDHGEIQQALLLCSAQHVYPVVRGIPRMLPGTLASARAAFGPAIRALPAAVQVRFEAASAERDPRFERDFAHTLKSFSSEWDGIREAERAWGLDVAARRDMFLRAFDLRPDELAGQVILDAGCGHGEVEMALLGTGAEVFAMDLSSSVDAVAARLQRIDPEAAARVHLVQGNVHFPPFREGAFDLVHSAGVLHHTPDTRRGFEAASRRTRPGGACYIEVYTSARKNKAAYAIACALRRITIHLPHRLLHLLCFAGAPFLGTFTRTYNAVSRRDVYRRRTLREMELSLFDALSPRYAHHHTLEEVVSWFAALNFRGMRQTYESKNGFGVFGTAAVR